MMIHDKDQRVIWLQKIQQGTFTQEDMREIVVSFSKGRVSASYASEGAKTKRVTKKVEDSTFDLWDGLGNETVKDVRNDIEDI